MSTNRILRSIRISTAEARAIMAGLAREIRRPVDFSGWEGHRIICSSPGVQGSAVACSRDGSEQRYCPWGTNGDLLALSTPEGHAGIVQIETSDLEWTDKAGTIFDSLREAEDAWDEDAGGMVGEARGRWVIRVTPRELNPRKASR